MLRPHSVCECFSLNQSVPLVTLSLNSFLCDETSETASRRPDSRSGGLGWLTSRVLAEFESWPLLGLSLQQGLARVHVPSHVGLSPTLKSAVSPAPQVVSLTPGEESGRGYSRVCDKGQGSSKSSFLLLRVFQKVGLLTAQGVCRVSGGLSPAHLDGLSLLLRSATALLSERGAGHGGQSLVHKAWGTKRLPCLGAPRGPAVHWHRLLPATLCLGPCAGSSAHAVTQAARSPRPAAMPLEDGKRWMVIKPGVCCSCWCPAWWWWRLY